MEVNTMPNALKSMSKNQTPLLADELALGFYKFVWSCLKDGKEEQDGHCRVRQVQGKFAGPRRTSSSGVRVMDSFHDCGDGEEIG
eukprot:27162-Amphidinium_carterae.4